MKPVCEHTLPLSVVAAKSLTSASASDCKIPIVIFHASIYLKKKLGVFQQVGGAFVLSRTDF